MGDNPSFENETDKYKESKKKTDKEPDKDKKSEFFKGKSGKMFMEEIQKITRDQLDKVETKIK